MEHPPCSPEWSLNDFWLFPEIKSALKGQRFQDKGHPKRRDDGTESYSTTGVLKMFPTVAALLG
jgi:hypothetical protein